MAFQSPKHMKSVNTMEKEHYALLNTVEIVTKEGQMSFTQMKTIPPHI